MRWHERNGEKNLQNSTGWLSTLKCDKVFIDSKSCRRDGSTCRVFYDVLPKILPRFISMDETWLDHFTPETTEQSKQWTEGKNKAEKRSKDNYICWQGYGASFFWMFLGKFSLSFSYEIKKFVPPSTSHSPFWWNYQKNTGTRRVDRNIKAVPKLT